MFSTEQSIGLPGPARLNLRGAGLRGADRGWFRLHQQVARRLLRILENAIWQDAEIQRGRDADGERESQSEWNGAGRDLVARLAHVHHHDDAQVVVGADRAVDLSDEGQPNQIRLYRGTEDIELGEKSAGHGDADQREQENGESS